MSTKRRKLTTEELLKTWDNDKDGEYIQINDKGVFFVAHGSAQEQIECDPDDPYPGIRAWMDRRKYWPNIWSVNDHGNVTLHDQRGNDLGGLV